MALSNFDQDCLNLTIKQAKSSFDAGNYPVGAVLAIDETVVADGNNSGETTGNYSNHAETSIIISHGNELLQASKDKKTITLYSTLEPCLMCLGVAVMNKVSRIIYIQPDPLAGACHLDRKSLEVRYQETWPEINQTDFSPVPLNLIKDFLNHQISTDIRVDWSQRFLSLLG